MECRDAIRALVTSRGLEPVSPSRFVSREGLYGLIENAAGTGVEDAAYQLMFASQHVVAPSLTFWDPGEALDLETNDITGLVRIIALEVSTDVAMAYNDATRPLAVRVAAARAVGRITPRGMRRTTRYGDGSVADAEALIGSAMYTESSALYPTTTRFHRHRIYAGATDVATEYLLAEYPRFEFRFKQPCATHIFVYLAPMSGTENLDALIPYAYEAVRCPPMMESLLWSSMRRAHECDHFVMAYLGSSRAALEACRGWRIRPCGVIGSYMIDWVRLAITAQIGIRHSIDSRSPGMSTDRQMMPGSAMARVLATNGSAREAKDIEGVAIAFAMRAAIDLFAESSPEREMRRILEASFGPERDDPYGLFGAAVCLRSARRYLMRGGLPTKWELRAILDEWITSNASMKYANACADIEEIAGDGADPRRFSGIINGEQVAHILESRWRCAGSAC